MLSKQRMFLPVVSLFLSAQLLFPQLQAQEAGSALPAGTLYYTGLVDDVWQIFSVSFPGGKPQQLTRSPGDKREPVWIEGNEKLLARSSNGDIVAISPEGQTEVFAHFTLPVANFSFFRDGKNLLSTHLTSRTYRKQWIYKATAVSPETVLFTKPASGSYRRVRLSPDNSRFACTMIQTYGEERLVVGDIENPSKVRLLTAEGSSTGYPCWSPDGKTLYFSMMRPQSGTWDLCSADVGSGDVSCLASTSGLDESAPFADSSGGLFFHCSGKEGLRIGHLNLADGKTTLIPVTGKSQEPFFKSAAAPEKGDGP
jgi:WD40-like Beta Propeller Repeat